MLKRICSFLLAFVMIVCLLPVTAMTAKAAKVTVAYVEAYGEGYEYDSTLHAYRPVFDHLVARDANGYPIVIDNILETGPFYTDRFFDEMLACEPMDDTINYSYIKVNLKAADVDWDLATSDIVIKLPGYIMEVMSITEMDSGDYLEIKYRANKLGITETSGTCGENLTWTLEDGILTIFGEGEMSYSEGAWDAYKADITSVIVEDGVTSIDNNAFDSCTALTEVSIADSVKTIGIAAFATCENLTKIRIPTKVTRIGDFAFSCCKSLKEITIPNSVTSIGMYAFRECRTLTSVTLPENLTAITEGTFESCSSLTEITIPKNVTNLDSSAFYFCNNLTEIHVDADNKYYCGDSNGILYDKGMETLLYVPAGFTGSLTIPSGVRVIGDFAMYQCKKITEVSVPGSVIGVGQMAFIGCTGLAEVTFAGNSPTFGRNAFLSVTADVCYPAGNDTWTSDVMQNYGGTITWVPWNVPQETKITTQPVNTYVKSGVNASLSVKATGTGLTYQWQYRTSSTGTWNATTLTGAKTATLTVPGAVSRNGYQYRCVVTDANGNTVTSNAATLTVFGIKTQPASASAKAGATVTFKVAAIGNGLTYQWQWRANSSSTWAATTVSGNKSATISVPATAARNGYQYRCKITDSKGNVLYSNAATLTVKSGPVINTQPASVTANVGATATFKVVATGTGLTYQWQWRANASSTWASTTVSGNRTAAISVPATAARNGYQYRCKITDANNNVVYSNAVTLTVKAALAITTQPKSVTANVGEIATFKVVATGTGLTYQWQWRKNASSAWAATTVSGNKTATITVPATAARNGYQYRCKITDANGKIVYSNAATLTVKSGPVINTQPKSQTANVGETATFKVVATGTGLTYQWQWRANSSSTWASTTVSGNKTATISVPATAARNGYQYRCKITDANGNVIYSNAATLTVK